MIEYPTIDAVEAADKVQLARWMRFLASPGWIATGRPDFESILDGETEIMKRIGQRFAEAGGMTPAISKEIGWETP